MQPHAMITCDATHTYRTPDGRTVPGVTRILSDVLGNQWAGKATQYHLDRGILLTCAKPTSHYVESSHP